MNTKGITLVEVLLYLAIFSVLIVTIISFSTRISLSQVKTQSLEEIQQESRYVMERLTIDSDNNIDLDSTYELIDGVIYRSSVALTSDQVNITDFSLTYMTTAAIYPSVKVDLTVQDASYGQRKEYNNEITLSTVLTLRQ